MIRKRGFTLIELIVSIGIFSLVATLTVGALLIMSSAERRTFDTQTSQDNVRFALETMAREIRTGNCYKGASTVDTSTPCSDLPADTNQCAGKTDCFQFRNSFDQDVVYRRVSSPTFTSAQITAICGSTNRCVAKMVKNKGVIGWGALNPITAPTIDFETLMFTLYGESEADRKQPRVTIITNSTIQSKNQIIQAEVQTTISQLRRDI